MPTPGRTQFASFVSHETPRPHMRRGNVHPYAGMPVGAEFFSNWWTRYQVFNRVADLPVTTVGWTITPTGAASAATMSTDLVPPHLILTTDAADNDSIELQWTAADGGGEFVDLTTGRSHYFETMIRFTDANNDTATVQQNDWFVGWAVTDTTVIDGATDFIGFTKRDITDRTTGEILFVAGDAGGAAGALVDQSVTATGWTVLTPTGGAANTTTDRNNLRLGANQWIRLAMLVDPLADGSGGAAYVFVNNKHVTTVNLLGVVPNENICTTIVLQNGVAVAKIMHVAYILESFAYENI